MANVVIIGGGLAGLTALHELKKHGIDATLFEASDRTGGRIKTLRYGNDTIDVGAGYFHKYYVGFLRLTGELGLENRIKQSQKKGLGFVKDGETVFLKTGELFRSLPIKDVLSLAKLKRDAKRNVSKGVEALQRYDEVDETKFPELMEDYRNRFGDYARNRTRLVRENILDPIFRWTLFSPSSDWNYAVGMAILLPMSTPLLEFDGGMETITDALYERLKNNVKLESPVEHIERLPKGCVVKIPGEEVQSDYVICASPSGPVPTGMRYNKTEIYVVHGSLKKRYDRGQGTLLSQTGNIDGITKYGKNLFKVISSNGNPDFGEFFGSYDIAYVQKWDMAVPVISSDAEFPNLRRDARIYSVGDFYLPCMEMSVATARKAAQDIYAGNR